MSSHVSPNHSGNRWGPRSEIQYGILTGFFSAFFFALMALCIKLSKGELSTSHLLFVRAACTVLILTAVSHRKLPILFKPGAQFVWIRSAFGGLSTYCYFWNVAHSSISIATVLTDVTPIFI